MEMLEKGPNGTRPNLQTASGNLPNLENKLPSLSFLLTTGLSHPAPLKGVKLLINHYVTCATPSSCSFPLKSLGFGPLRLIFEGA